MNGGEPRVHSQFQQSHWCVNDGQMQPSGSSWNQPLPFALQPAGHTADAFWLGLFVDKALP